MTNDIIDTTKVADAFMLMRCLPSDNLNFPKVQSLELFEIVYHVDVKCQEPIYLHHLVDTPPPTVTPTEIELDPEPSTFESLLEQGLPRKCSALKSTP